jgi:putative hydrolase of the HAD superfamily
LALLTNGNGVVQRRKVDRFGLTELFDVILIEGEVGFGKPDPRIYTRALGELMVAPAAAWMVGDNLEWDVAQPQRMGLLGVWVDVRGVGVPDSSAVRPHRIVRALSELRQLADP